MPGNERHEKQCKKEHRQGAQDDIGDVASCPALDAVQCRWLGLSGLAVGLGCAIIAQERCPLTGRVLCRHRETTERFDNVQCFLFVSEVLSVGGKLCEPKGRQAS